MLAISTEPFSCVVDVFPIDWLVAEQLTNSRVCDSNAIEHRKSFPDLSLPPRLGNEAGVPVAMDLDADCVVGAKHRGSTIGS